MTMSSFDEVAARMFIALSTGNTISQEYLNRIYGIENPQPRSSGMNYSTALFALNKDLRAVLAVYDTPANQPNGKKQMFKTLNQDIQVGDIIVVPTETRHGMTCVKVTDVDVEVDLDDPTPVAWVIDRVNVTDWQVLVKQENEALKIVRDAAFAERKKKIRDSIVANASELTSLPIYKNGDTAKPINQE